ncbi:serine hydrolase domain-containing protein [Streptomyces griseocarneus]|uniref:serine hydrolase domain-containing protein n=1 Tax=Streptomyces griseocarneus TaxID=51201 RepID=UPI00167D4CA7|nr:serine hydrolase domain-containing protein [Streptomyces griseocarneus]MBZ6475969.1 beta-lactamase family protein [Streptomyces griseocarneus]GHG49776.1 D-alanyl-D-alanine carboxypeptidase [Streptomyces griseocarneus]
MTARTVRRALTGAALATALATTALTTTASADTGRAGDRHSATRAVMEAQVRAGVPGVLGRAEDARGTWNASAGVGDRRTGRDRLPQDRFRVGSITKAFVSTVLLQLEAEGRLDIDDSVERWLPGVVRGNGHDGSRITIRSLLNHTSGVFNYTEDPAFFEQLTTGFPEHRFETRTPRQLVAAAMQHKPYFSPGKGWHYSNTNYVLAGMIVEKATGHSYASEVDKRVINKLGMRSTTLPGTSSRVPGPHGRAYSKLSSTAPDAKIHDVTELNPSWGGAAGEIISTTGDLNRFYRALLRGDLLPERQQRELLTTVPVSDTTPDARYGLGVSSGKLSCGVTVWMHSGGIHGSTSIASATADGSHTAAFNFNGDWSGDLDALIEAEYCGAKPSAAADKTGPGLKKLTSLR